MTTVGKYTAKVLNNPFGVFLAAVSCLVFYMPYQLEIMTEIQTPLFYARWFCVIILFILFWFLYVGSLDLIIHNVIMFAAIPFILLLVYLTKSNGSDMTAVLSYGGLLALANLLMFAVFLRSNPKIFLLVFYFVYFAVVAINTYTVYAYWGTGMWESYMAYKNSEYFFTGNFNLCIIYVIPMIICGAVWARRYGWWLELLNYPIMIAALMAGIKCDSLNQEYVYVLIIVLLIISDIMRAWKGLYKVLRFFCNSVVMVGVNLAAFIMVVLMDNSALWTKLGIDPAFHHRTYIWTVTKELIAANPKGYGLELDWQFAAKFPNWSPSHSHCMWLQIPYDVGIIGTILFIAALIICCVAIFRAKNWHTRFLMSGIFGIFMLGCLVESYSRPFIFVALGLIYYICATDPAEEEGYSSSGQPEEPYVRHEYDADVRNRAVNRYRSNQRSRY